ncbi:LEA type 2 family protein [Halomarina oriensis]|uniref:Water stress and hypersensitive response domain-containing protein n=1 Tax=Halomarina oriensis TaxID=671145 RepID=A0A6B0GPC9_9EURY|nr:LEA type 2 family protein [Halomarina oriensis]MWG35841.1 hypothetical protein [Halomarina oriensis]
MKLRGLLFGGKLRVVAVVFLLVAASVVGAYTLGLVGRPAVTDVENRFGDVDRNETTIRTDLALSNPNPVGVRLGGASVDYTVYMNDVEMAQGGRDGVNLPRGDSELGFTTQMDNERIPAWWVSHIENDERTEVTIDASVHSSTLGRSFDLPQRRTIETDIIGQFRSTEDRPVNANQPLVSDPVLVVRETDAQWGEVTEARTPIDASMTVYNPKSVPYVVTEIGYNVTMNDVPVGNGTTDEGYVIPAGAEKTVGTTMAIDNSRLDEWWVTHLRNDQVTEMRIDFHATIRLPNGETVRVPLDALTYTKTIETDIFGTKNASTNGSASAGETTPATTAGPTSTRTQPPTTSDDGGLLGGDGTTTSTRPTETAAGTTTDDGGLLGAADTETATTPAPTATRTENGTGGLTGGGTETDDGGLP